MDHAVRARQEQAPIPPWPGDFRTLGAQGEVVYLRSASAPAEAVDAAEPALLVHGFGGSSTNWTDLMGLLRDTVPALACDAVDLPGCGQSPPSPRSRYSVGAQAETVAAVIERSGRGPVHLVGNSLGGAICARVAAARPELVTTLTLISPAMPDLWPRPAMLRFPALCIPGFGNWLLRRTRNLSATTRVELMLAGVYFDPAHMHPLRFAEEVAEVERRDRLDYDEAVLLASARSIVLEYVRRGGGTLWRDAARVVAPTLVLYGSHDKLVDARMAGRAARTFFSGRVVVLSRTGHVAHMEYPAAVAEEIAALLASARTTPDAHVGFGPGRSVRLPSVAS